MQDTIPRSVSSSRPGSCVAAAHEPHLEQRLRVLAPHLVAAGEDVSPGLRAEHGRVPVVAHALVRLETAARIDDPEQRVEAPPRAFGEVERVGDFGVVPACG